MIAKGRTAPALPLGPLQRYIGAPDDVHLAQHLGTSREMVARWRRQGIPEWRADKLAVGAGVHPGVLWPQWWDYS